MRIFALIVIGIAISGVVMAQNEREIDLRNLRDLGIDITGIQFTVNEPQCEVKYFSPFDTKQDGILDRVCVGLQYDTCDPNGEAEAYFEFQRKGGVCKTTPPAPVPEPVVYCDENKIVVSPTVCVER